MTVVKAKVLSVADQQIVFRYFNFPLFYTDVARNTTGKNVSVGDTVYVKVIERNTDEVVGLVQEAENDTEV